ncbi:N-terminal Xaa-Pro-Lys N-methyltransferase 1-A [Patella vulgata]|uniref:N-terminal Xaa-Pro-Lys N-methyltransferase 1-A n=1 Tax=Patella vulgata TaxID=6465 RepID=UPI0021808D9F|nr:N-terminal Xaa-Pro-Lys N-methyltransferase 1-A [Patella vulgata]
MADQAEENKQSEEEVHYDLKVIDEKFYGDAKVYWEKISPTVDGMLGGFAKISPTDINGSRAFLRPFMKISGGKVNNKKALDCGAGIGRITKRLLLPMFDSVDMVELNQHFLNEARAFIGSESKRVDNLFCSGLQEFIPEIGRYDVIWCQWVLGHLKDKHLIDFFKRCKSALSPNGMIIVKENTASDTERDFDSSDSSFTRPRREFVDLITQSGLTIVKEEKQKGFPKGVYDVFMFALR